MYLLDTNVVIDFFGNKLPATGSAFVAGIDTPAISVITAIELFALATMPNDEKAKLQDFVSFATVYNNINNTIVTNAINIRLLKTIKTPDAIIAATALAFDLTLLTRNTNDFKNIDGLNVVNPWEV